jgi:hypothetical protein
LATTASFIAIDTKKLTNVLCAGLYLSSHLYATLAANGLQLNHTRSMSGLNLHYDQASAVLPIMQQNYSNIANIFNFPRIYIF